MSVLGIDVSKDTLDVVWMDAQRQTQYCQVENAASGYAKLKRWLRKRPVDGVCLEATGRYSEGVAEYLHEAGSRGSGCKRAPALGLAPRQLRPARTGKPARTPT